MHDSTNDELPYHPEEEHKIFRILESTSRSLVPQLGRELTFTEKQSITNKLLQEYTSGNLPEDVVQSHIIETIDPTGFDRIVKQNSQSELGNLSVEDRDIFDQMMELDPTIDSAEMQEIFDAAKKYYQNDLSKLTSDELKNFIENSKESKKPDLFDRLTAKYRDSDNES